MAEPAKMIPVHGNDGHTIHGNDGHHIHGNDGFSIDVKASRVWVAAGMAFLVLATAIGAWIRVPLPFTPVPVTLQSFAVLLGAALLGRSRGGFSMLAYVALGSIGLPLFAGIAVAGPYLFGPTGGYLIGFIAAAFFVGSAFSRRADYGPWATAGLFAAGTALIFIPGLVWLQSWLGGNLYQTLLMGFVPFLPGAVVKLVIATTIYQSLQSRSRFHFN